MHVELQGECNSPLPLFLLPHFRGITMPKEHILIVDDEESILELLEYNLAQNGYQVTCAANGKEALKLAESDSPDVILLDLMLPGIDGLRLCNILKNSPKTSDIPVIMLTAKGEESDIVIGLEMGADDYIVKPFSPKVLIARIRAVLRKHTKEPAGESHVIKISDLLLDPERHEVLIEGQPIELTCSEFKLLGILAGKPGRVFTRNQIIDTIRGDDYAVTERSVDVQIVGLRKKLGAYGKYIQSVRGVGYRFKE